MGRPIKLYMTVFTYAWLMRALSRAEIGAGVIKITIKIARIQFQAI